MIIHVGGDANMSGRGVWVGSREALFFLNNPLHPANLSSPFLSWTLSIDRWALKISNGLKTDRYNNASPA